MEKTNLDRVNEYFKEHKLFSETYRIAAKEILDRYQKEQLNIGVVSNSALIDYIENDAEIAMPIDEFFNEDGTHITKKQYGKVLLKYLVKELREHYC